MADRAAGVITFLVALNYETVEQVYINERGCRDGKLVKMIVTRHCLLCSGVYSKDHDNMSPLPTSFFDPEGTLKWM